MKRKLLKTEFVAFFSKFTYVLLFTTMSRPCFAAWLSLNSVLSEDVTVYDIGNDIGKVPVSVNDTTSVVSISKTGLGGGTNRLEILSRSVLSMGSPFSNGTVNQLPSTCGSGWPKFAEISLRKLRWRSN